MVSLKRASDLADQPELSRLWAEIVRPCVSLSMSRWTVDQSLVMWADARFIARQGNVVIAAPDAPYGLTMIKDAYDIPLNNIFYVSIWTDMSNSVWCQELSARIKHLNPIYVVIIPVAMEPWNIVSHNLRVLSRELNAAVDVMTGYSRDLSGVDMARTIVGNGAEKMVHCLKWRHGPKFPDRVCSLFPGKLNENLSPVRLMRRPIKKRNLRGERMRQQEYLWDDRKKAEMLAYFSYQCAYCGAYLGEDGRNMHADHYIPVSAKNCPGKVPWNMVPACPECNLNKHAKQPDLWLAERFGADAAWAIKDTIERYFSEVQDA